MRCLEDLAQCHSVLRHRLERALEMAEAVVLQQKPPSCRTFLSLRRSFLEFSSELQSYLDREQIAVFPALQGRTSWLQCMDLAETVGLLRRGQDGILCLMSDLCETTQGFETPVDACPCYGAFLDVLRDIRAAVLKQFDLENEEIFPNALSLAEASVN